MLLVRLPSDRGALGAQTGDDIGHGFNLASRDILVAQREDFQQRQCFLSLFERGHVLQDGLGLTVLGDDQGLALLCEVPQNLGSVRFEVADRLDLR